jgi:hypothetical protein
VRIGSSGHGALRVSIISRALTRRQRWPLRSIVAGAARVVSTDLGSSGSSAGYRVKDNNPSAMCAVQAYVHRACSHAQFVLSPSIQKQHRIFSSNANPLQIISCPLLSISVPTLWEIDQTVSVRFCLAWVLSCHAYRSIWPGVRVDACAEQVEVAYSAATDVWTDNK